MKTADWRSTFVFLLTTILASTLFLPASSDIGINYGTNGDNLPSAADALNIYKRCNIRHVRLFNPNHYILDALRKSGISVTLGTLNDDLPGLALANNPNAAKGWLDIHVMPYKDDVLFEYITLGNEVIPGPLAFHVPNAMANFRVALQSLGLGSIKVTTVVPTTVLENSYPPSSATFSNEVVGVMTSIVTQLHEANTPLMINVYPYFAYAAEPEHISLEYATFQATRPIVVDGEYQYYNLFDAMVDSFHAAIDKLGLGETALAIAETGWPSAGNKPYASKENAMMYNSNLIKHVAIRGTPRRPEQLMETFIFALFNENLKSGEVEQNFGLYYPNMDPVYPLLNC